MSARSRMSVLAGATVILAIAGGLAACGSDDEGGANTLPPVVTTAGPSTLSPVTAAPPTPAPVTPPPATAPPATAAPATTATSTSTSTTVAETTTSTTSPPRAAALVLRDNGLGTASFGTDPDEVIAYVRSIVGAPTTDTGWVDPFSVFGVCPGTEVRGVTWGDLTLLFSDSSVITSGRRHFFHYSYGPPFGSTIEPDGMRTSGGIGIGSTIAEVRAAFPGVVVNPADDIFDANFYVSDTFRGFLSGSADTDQVTSIAGGVGCGE